MSCWICGQEAKTGEHLVKASDLRYYFGQVTTQQPVYFHMGDRRWTMQSTNSKYVKSEAKICNSCNSDKTQPFDKDWALMSQYLQDNFAQLSSNGKIKLANVFPGRKSEAMLNIHLYFSKLFGCRLASEDTPLSLEPFRQAINLNQQCNNLFIKFCTWEPTNKCAGITSIKAVEKDNAPIVVWWFYIIGKVAVYVSYNFNPEIKKLTRRCWHPDRLEKYVEFKQQNT